MTGRDGAAVDTAWCRDAKKHCGTKHRPRFEALGILGAADTASFGVNPRHMHADARAKRGRPCGARGTKARSTLEGVHNIGAAMGAKMRGTNAEPLAAPEGVGDVMTGLHQTANCRSQSPVPQMPQAGRP